MDCSERQGLQHCPQDSCPGRLCLGDKTFLPMYYYHFLFARISSQLLALFGSITGHVLTRVEFALLRKRWIRDGACPAPAKLPSLRFIGQETSSSLEARALQASTCAFIAFGMCFVTFTLPFSAAYSWLVLVQHSALRSPVERYLCSPLTTCPCD